MHACIRACAHTHTKTKWKSDRLMKEMLVIKKSLHNNAVLVQTQYYCMTLWNKLVSLKTDGSDRRGDQYLI